MSKLSGLKYQICRIRHAEYVELRMSEPSDQGSARTDRLLPPGGTLAAPAARSCPAWASRKRYAQRRSRVQGRVDSLPAGRGDQARWRTTSRGNAVSDHCAYGRIGGRAWARSMC